MDYDKLNLNLSLEEQGLSLDKIRSDKYQIRSLEEGHPETFKYLINQGMTSKI